MALLYFAYIGAPITIVVALSVFMLLDIKEEHERNASERNIAQQESYSDEEEFDF